MTVQVTIARLGDRSPLAIDNADWLAEAFFAMDPSGKPGGFDDKARESAPTRIEAKDVDAINGTMRARSPQKAWTALKGRELRWLAGLSADWDLAGLDDGAWGGHVAPALETALTELLQKGRGVSVSTKMLHLKRPRLVPVLDSLVVAQLGSPMPTTAGKAVVLIAHVRRVVHDNAAPLQQIIDYLGLQWRPAEVIDRYRVAAGGSGLGRGRARRRHPDVALAAYRDPRRGGCWSSARQSSVGFRAGASMNSTTRSDTSQNSTE